MAYDSFRHARGSIRLKNYDYSSQGAYFVTICTSRREAILGSIAGGEIWISELGAIVGEEWNRTARARESVELDEFVIMPNHIHGIIFIHDHVGAVHELPLRSPSHMLQDNMLSRRRMLLPLLIGSFKMNSAKRINALTGTGGNPVWQRNYYERIIRDDAELYNVRRYIQENPTKWSEDPENPIL